MSVGYLVVEAQVAHCITKSAEEMQSKVKSRIVANTQKLKVFYLRIGKSMYGIVCYVNIGWQKLVIKFLVLKIPAIQGYPV